MKHSASAIFYPIQIVSDLGYMAGPLMHRGPSRLGGDRRREWIVAMLQEKDGRRRRWVTGLGPYGLAWQILCNPPTSPIALFTVCR